MRMTNRTKWRTDELRIIARRVAEQELESHERKMVHLTITTPFMNVKANQVRKARPPNTGFIAREAKSRYSRTVILWDNFSPRFIALLFAWHMMQIQSSHTVWLRSSWKRYNDSSYHAWADQYSLVARS